MTDKLNIWAWSQALASVNKVSMKVLRIQEFEKIPGELPIVYAPVPTTTAAKYANAQRRLAHSELQYY